MAIPSSGPMWLSEVMDEYGASGPTMLTDLYRGAGIIKDNAPNNQGTNHAESVPTSGPLSMSDFYGTEPKFSYQIGGTWSDTLNVLSMAGDDAISDWTREVELTSSFFMAYDGFGAIRVPSDAQGVRIINRGDVRADDGTLYLQPNSEATVENLGAIRAAGGDGGTGGTGGQGGPGWADTSYTERQPESGFEYTGTEPLYVYMLHGSGSTYAHWGDPSGSPSQTYPSHTDSFTGTDGWTYFSGPLVSGNLYEIARDRFVEDGYETTGGDGGAGGSGGTGRSVGVNRTDGSPGSAGSPGGEEAGAGGTGGTGGDGGDWGEPGGDGETGSTGASGSEGSGSAGSAGSAGSDPNWAIWLADGASITFSTEGTIQGRRND